MKDDTFSELASIISELESLSLRFINSPNSGLYLKTEDDSLFKQMLMEALNLLDETFDENNRYSRNITHTVNHGLGGYLGGPSKKCVMDVIGILKAAQKHAIRGVTKRRTRNNYVEAQD